MEWSSCSFVTKGKHHNTELFIDWVIITFNSGYKLLDSFFVSVGWQNFVELFESVIIVVSLQQTDKTFL